MIKNIINIVVNGTTPTVKSFKAKHTNEVILFSSESTLSEFKNKSGRGIFRRGVFILTHNFLFFSSVLLSIHSLFYVTCALICFSFFLISFDIAPLIASIFVGAMTIQRLPLKRQILLSEIREAKLDSIKGGFFAGGKMFYRLNVVAEKMNLFFMLSEKMSDEQIQKLGISLKNTSEQNADK